MDTPPTDADILEKFIYDLRTDIRTQVELSDPIDFATAEKHAVYVESVLNRTFKGKSNLSRPFGNNYTPRRQAETYPQPMDLDNANSTPLPKLDDKERQRCIQNNLCFRCRKPGHSRFKCPKAAPNMPHRINILSASSENGPGQSQ
jgi:hypothetical protein